LNAEYENSSDGWRLCISVAALLIGLRYLISGGLIGAGAVAGQPGGSLAAVFIIFAAISILLAVRTRRQFLPPWSIVAAIWVAIHLLMMLISIAS
jgi:hypothetical protein